MRITLLMIISLVFTSCGTIYSGLPSDKSFLTRFNGNSYNAEITPYDFIPFGLGVGARRRAKESTFKGKAFFLHEEIEYPIRFKKVLVTKDSKILGETSTDHKGRFVITGNYPDGKYTLILKKGIYSGVVKVKLKGYEKFDLKLQGRKLDDLSISPSFL